MEQSPQSQQTSPFQQPYISPEQTLLEKLDKLITAKLREEKLPNYYAKACGMRLTVLNKITLKQKGKTVSELIDQKLLHEIKHQLWHTSQPAKVISYLYGFSDPSYFYRYFKRETGISIRQFRQREVTSTIY